MTVAANIHNAFLLASVLLLQSVAGKLETVATSIVQHNRFSMQMFNVMASLNAQTNFVFSPLSVQTCLALAYFAADGNTAKELRLGLKLTTSGSDEEIATAYSAFLKDVFTPTDNGPELKTAYRIYLNETLALQEDFNEIATKHFDASVEKIKFVEKAAAAKKMNDWVAQQTNNKITELISESALAQDVSTVFINVVYFKGRWQFRFNTYGTTKKAFKISETQTVTVDMMYNEARLNYAEIAALQAKFLEMPYEFSDVTMVLVLPNNAKGLTKLERKLSRVNLNVLLKQLTSWEVHVSLPKFKVELDVNLEEALRRLGIVSMFDEKKADFSKLFSKDSKQRLGEVRHRAVIEVNEIGTEAAAATFIKIAPVSLTQYKTFDASHPFLFIIRSPNAILFMGRVQKF